MNTLWIYSTQHVTNESTVIFKIHFLCCYGVKWEDPDDTSYIGPECGCNLELCCNV